MSIREFVFNGILTHDGLVRLSDSGIRTDLTPVQDIVERGAQAEFPSRLLNAAGRMASVFVLFFCIENSARELITQRLAERYGSSWWDQKVPQRIREVVEKLRASESVHRYHTARSSEMIGYTMFGQLEQIIVSNWDDFKDIFNQQSWISSRFSDLEKSRNIIMHTGVLAEYEIERVEMIVRDWVRQTGG